MDVADNNSNKTSETTFGPADGGLGEEPAPPVLGCPFHNKETGVKVRTSSRQMSSQSAGWELLSHEEKTFVKVACPILSGGSEANAALLRKLCRNSSIFDVVDHHDEDGAVGEQGTKTKVKFSYTATNPDFPQDLQEDDLFGHSPNDGIFAKETGFLIPNYDEAVEKLLQCRGRVWYALGKRLSGLFLHNRLIDEVDNMEIVDGDEAACPDESLHIASSILAFLSMGYRAACWRNHLVHEPAPALEVPWRKICQRLGRKDTYCAIGDFIYQCYPIHGNSFESHNTNLISPLWNNRAERLLTKLLCESNQHLTIMLPSILALCRGEWEAVHLQNIILEMGNMTKMMANVMPDGSNSEWAMDPVDFAVSFVHATAPTKEGVPALTGAGCPIFSVLDIMLGRQEWSSQLGHDLLMQMEWMPKNWRRFIEYLRQKQLFKNVPEHLEYLWTLLKLSYVGDRGWLGEHKDRAFQFVELGTVLGRQPNTGDGHGTVTAQMLSASMKERSPDLSVPRSSFKTCPFRGTIKQLKLVSSDSNTQLVTIESSKLIHICTGDHISILMKNSDTAVSRFAAEHELSLQAMLSLEDGSLTDEWKERLDHDKLIYNVMGVLKCAKLGVSHASVDRISSGNICKLLVPEEPRLYSFANIEARDMECLTTVDLLVTRVGPGGCSAYMYESVGEEISFGISTGSRFSLPSNSTTPVVIIAAGSGVGTYFPVLMNSAIRNPRYAFLAFRTEEAVPYLQKMEKAVNLGKLNLFVELSREETSLVTKKRGLMHEKTEKRYLDSMMKEHADLLSLLAAPLNEGGMEAHFFVCGNNDFFQTVKHTWDEIDDKMISNLTQSSRLHLEIQARNAPEALVEAQSIGLAEMCFHNHTEDFWVAIHGVVYDFTTYLRWHPGGTKIFQYLAGTDCSEEWEAVGHGADRMIYSQLNMYEVGKYVQDDGVLNKLLELVTRAGNCVRMYEDRHSLFENLCDSYGRVQAMVESVFGKRFLDVLLLLEIEAYQQLLRQLWAIKKGSSRAIADQMYKVAPVRECHSGATHVFVSSVGVKPVEALHDAGSEERNLLKDRLMDSCNIFFESCKNALTKYAKSNSKEMNEEELSAMMRKLVISLEQLYSSLCAPVVLKSTEKQNTIQMDVKNDEIDAEFLRLIGRDVVAASKEQQEALIQEILNSLEVDDTTITRLSRPSMITTDDWIQHDDKHIVFNQLDKDGDGLITREDINTACDDDVLAPAEIEFLKFFKMSKLFSEQLTFSFADFLTIIPDVAETGQENQIQVNANS